VDEFIKFGGWLTGFLGAAVTAWSLTRKTKVDESGQALQAWKDMTARHENEIASLLERENDKDAEIVKLRSTLREVEDGCYAERIGSVVLSSGCTLRCFSCIPHTLPR
jgi:hypothetical protein